MEWCASVDKFLARRIVVSALVASVLLSTVTAQADFQPRILYDGRSAGLGGTGVAFIDSGAASFHNPANMDKIKTSATTLTFSPLLMDVTAPLIGLTPNQSGETSTGYAFAPYGHVGTAWRVHEPVVLGLSALLVSNFSLDYPTTPVFGVDSTMHFVQWELQIPVSIRVSDALSFGAAYRMTFANLNVQALAIFLPFVASVSGSDFSGIQLGMHVQPSHAFELGLNYRNQIDVAMSGAYHFGITSSQSRPTSATASLPHSLVGGFAIHLVEDTLLLAGDVKGLFYSQTSSTSTQGNAWSAAFGVECWTSPMVPLRVGASYGEQGIAAANAQLLNVPPGKPVSVGAGSGVAVDGWKLDAAINYIWSSHTVPPVATSNGPVVEPNLQDPGKYTMSSIQMTLAATYAF